MLINANPKSDENSWRLNDKIYCGNALMYSKIEDNGNSGCIWGIDDFRQLITFCSDFYKQRGMVLFSQIGFKYLIINCLILIVSSLSRKFISRKKEKFSFN